MSFFIPLAWGLFFTCVVAVALGLQLERHGRSPEPMYRAAFLLALIPISVLIVWLSTQWN